ncbi:MAG: hypothetical protein J5374_07980 [Bacteroidales bacterium]|nr:hypothetical protein [Bacteroidales bacterium]
MDTDLFERQRAFYESGNTMDTRSRRAMLQILANTVREVCGDCPETTAVMDQVKDVRKKLYKWTGTGRLRLLMSLFARPGKAGPVPHGVVLIDGGAAGDSAGAVLAPLVSALAAGNTAVVLLPDSPAGETVRRIVDETFTDDFVATVPAADEAAPTLRDAAFSFVYDCAGSLPCTGYEGFLTFSEQMAE